MAALLTPKLAQALNSIQVPTDYYHGTAALKAPIPENVLLFTRSHSDQLGPERACHYRFVLIMNFAGPGRVILDRKTFDFGAGDCFLVFPFQFHHYVLENPSPITWLFITFELQQPGSLSILRDAPLAIGSDCQPLLESITRAFPGHRSSQNRNDEFILLTSQLLNRLIGFRQKTCAPPGDHDRRESTLLDKVHEYVGAHIATGPRIDAIAHHVAVSESHLRLRYRQATGISLGHYIRELRVRKAMSLLSSSSLNISETAYACGYESLSAFVRSFRLRMGVTPREFRAEMRQKALG